MCMYIYILHIYIYIYIYMYFNTSIYIHAGNMLQVGAWSTFFHLKCQTKVFYWYTYMHIFYAYVFRIHLYIADIPVSCAYSYMDILPKTYMDIWTYYIYGHITITIFMYLTHFLSFEV